MEQNLRLRVSILIPIIYHSTEYLNSDYSGEFISSLSSSSGWTVVSLKRLLHISMIRNIRRMLAQKWACKYPMAKTALFWFYFEKKYQIWPLRQEWMNLNSLCLTLYLKTSLYAVFFYLFILFYQIMLLRLKHVGCLEAFLFSVRTSVNMTQSLVNADMHSANLVSPEMNLDAQKWWSSLILPTEDNV